MDVLLAQLNVDMEQTVNVVNNKSTIEQQFYNYMEVQILLKQIQRKSLLCFICLDFSVG